MEQQINLTVFDKENNVIEVRQGAALPLREPVKIDITGYINSPTSFLKLRVSEIHQLEAHILVNSDKFTITLVIDETNFYAGKIEGKLELSEIYKKFGINSGKQWTTSELADFIKMHRSFFQKPSLAASLVTDLKHFKAKVDKEIEQKDDNRGNKKMLYDQVVESNIPDSFTVQLPIFKGQKKQDIKVEVYINASSFECQLISPDAQDLIHSLTDGIIEEQLNEIREICPNIVIIYQ